MKVRPNIGTPLAAGFANEPWFEIGEPDVIRSSVRADRDCMAALVIRAIDQQAANAGFAHLSEADFLRAGDGGHALLKRRRSRQANGLPRSADKSPRRIGGASSR